MTEHCPTCGQRIMQMHKESLSRHKLTMLRMAAQHVIDNNTGIFKKSDIEGLKTNSDYNNFQKLRYHGLIAHGRIDGVKQRDRWLITRNGWAFLRGEKSLPKFVMVRDNGVVPESHSPTLWSIKDVYYGSDIIQTTFEYFDDDGKQIGFKPLTMRPSQPSLFSNQSAVYVGLDR